MSHFDDHDDNDPNSDEFLAESEHHFDKLYERISGYMDEEELSGYYVARLLVGMTVTMRMAAYVEDIERPSVAGLKLDLDRFRREIDEVLRQAKKGSEDFIAQVKSERAATEGEDEPKQGPQN